MAKSVKSRYKLCFQTQNKVWIYKNSRLRNFYRIRNKAVLLQGKVVKRFIVTNNMKWTVVRRKMVPYLKTRNRFRFQYKTLFFNKQQLKSFYGGLKEYELRNIFKKTWNVELFHRRNIFISALEQRLNIVLYRMRVLPTIFSSTQFIMHKGIFVNENTITLPSYRVKIGDVVSIPKEQWHIFYKYIFNRLDKRVTGERFVYWRKWNYTKKFHYYRARKKKFYVKVLSLLKKYSKCKKRFLFLKKTSSKLIRIFKKKKLNNKYMKCLIFLRIFIEKILYFNLLKIKRNLNKLRRWGKPRYYKNVHYIFFRLLYIERMILRIRSTLINLIIHSFKFTGISKNSKEILNIILKKLSKKKKKQFKSDIYLHKFLPHSYKKMLYTKNKNIRYKKRFIFLLKRIRYRKKKHQLFKSFCFTTQWYTPSYLEIDYVTLRSIFIYYPESDEVFYGFPCSFNKIISFYKERSL